MQTEQLEKQNWMSLSGKILDGGFELKDLIEADDSRALFRARVLGDRELVATTLFRRVDAPGAGRQVDLWQSVRALRDPHLKSPLGCGTADLNGSRTAYVVIRQPDESLGGALRERVLTPAEMKDAILNVAKGLEVLHLNGLVHGNVSPEQIVAIGDSIRLSTEGVRAKGVVPAFELIPATYLAPESKGTNLTPESDLWCLGATVFQSLTQKTWAESERDKAELLPEPFATIVLRCLTAEPGERCRLAEVVALAKGEIKPAPRPKPAPAPIPPTATVSPINEKEIHASGVNGTPPPPAPVSEPKPEATAARTAETRSPTPVPPPPQSATPPAAPAGGGTTKRDQAVAGKPAPENRVEPPVPGRKPIPIAATQPAAKVKPINEGPAPATLPNKPIRHDTSPRRDKFIVDERSSKVWVWAGVAVLAVLLLIWALRPKHPTATVAGPAAPSAVGTSTAQTRGGGNAWETKTIQPDGTASTPSAAAGAERKTPAAAPARPATASKPADKPHTPGSAAAAVDETARKSDSSSGSGVVWRTVLFTYNRQADADARAKILNGEHADLHAEVFSPSRNGPYLVCAGGRMTKEDAAEMRKRAVGLGLPHDSYIQNFKH